MARKLLIALGVVAALVVGAWVLVIAPAANRLATEQLVAAGFDGATVEIHADGLRVTIPEIPAGEGGSGVSASGLVVDIGGLGVDDIQALTGGSGTFALPAGTTLDVRAASATVATTSGPLGLGDLSLVGNDTSAQFSALIDAAVAERLQGAATGSVVTLPFDDRGITLTGATFTAEGGKVRLAGTVDMAALLGTLGGE